MNGSPTATPSRSRGGQKRRATIRVPRVFLYFDAVARHGSIRKAAEVLRIASSALNRQVLLLEEEVGAPLLERLPRGVRLTAAGEIFANYVRNTIAGLDTVAVQIEALQGLMRGRVRIAAVESAAGYFLPEVITAFQEAHPGVEFSLYVGAPPALMAELLSDSADILITHDLTGRQKDISVVARAPQTFCALVHRSHPLASRKRLRLRDCISFPLAIGDRSLAGRALIDSALATASASFRPALVSNSVAAMRSYARLGKGICFQYSIGSSDWSTSDIVALPLVDDALVGAELLLASRRERVLPSAAAAFIEMMRQRFQNLDQ